MSSVLIQHYLAELAKLRQVGGTHRESVVREAFKDLLKNWGRAHDLTFVPEYEIESPAKERRYVDGALLYGLRLPFGYWEAKDERDDLDAEIELKFKRGYPQDNIVFEDSREAVLIQNRREVIRSPVDDVDCLQRLLQLFFGYERPEIAEFRKAVEQFKADLPAVCEALRGMIEHAYADNTTFRAAADKFLKQAQKTINPSLGAADVREILIQHILTEEIFALVFPGSNYHEDNNIARELYKLEHTFFTGNTKHQTLRALEPYYAAIRRTAGQIASHHEKQAFLKVVYENFYKVYNPKAADRLGVVYTPNEIVRFMIESADWLCEKHFGRNLIDRDVEILDPAAGTGTFISELLEHFRGQPAKLKHKYLEELHANEVAILPYYVANLNIEATYADVVAREFNEIHIVDLGADIRANPKLSGTKHNVFGIQTGVAIGFLVKRAKAQGCRIFYSRRPEFETAEEKLAWLSRARLGELERNEIRPDAKHNWLNLTDNDFDSLIPVASKAAKAAKKPSQEKAIFKLFSLGVVTNRDEWVYGKSRDVVEEKVSYLINTYNAERLRLDHKGRHSKMLGTALGNDIKWTRAVKRDLTQDVIYSFNSDRIIDSMYRPFVRLPLYFDKRLNEMHYQLGAIFRGAPNPTIAFLCVISASPLAPMAVDGPFDLCFLKMGNGGTQSLPMWRYDESGNRVDNITDWALKQFKAQYKTNDTVGAKTSTSSFRRKPESIGSVVTTKGKMDPGLRRDDEQGEAEPSSGAARHLLPGGEGKSAARAEARAITKMDIFHYVYAVLHDPVYREKYAQNLKREFPRIPFYPDFWRWAEWGKALMDLHIDYETVEPWPLTRTDFADDKARKNGASPKPLLKADKESGRIVLDSETTLSGVPPEAWNYKLGNRSALEWILDQYKEKKPKDPTIREHFNTYRFADYKDKVIDLLARVTRVSVETQAIVEAMRAAPRPA